MKTSRGPWPLDLRGVQSTSALQCFRLLCVCVRRSSAFGAWFGVVVQEIKKPLTPKASDWSCATQVQRVQFMYRNTRHGSTHVTPASLITRSRLLSLSPVFVSSDPVFVQVEPPIRSRKLITRLFEEVYL